MDLQNKVALARQYGYSDNDINSYLLSSGQITTPKKQNKGNFLTSLLPTIGGTLGAVGGSFLAPVAGTVAGGAAGSAAGEWLRQHLTGDTEGGFGNIAKEAAFGAIPGVGKFAKGGVSALRASRNAKKAKDILSVSSGKKISELGGARPSNDLQRQIEVAHNTGNKQLEQQLIGKLPPELQNGMGIGNQTTRPIVDPITKKISIQPNEPSPTISLPEIDQTRPVNAMARTAERLFSRQTGIQPGAKVGSQVLTAKRAAELKDHIRTNINSKPIDAADTILRRNEAFIQNKSAELNTILAQNNKPLTDGVASKVVANMQKPTGIDLPSNGTYKSLLVEAQGIKDLQGLEQFRRNIDEIINFSRSAASPDPAAERVALSARRAIDNFMTNKIPALKPIKRELSKAYDVATYIQPAATKPSGIGIPFLNTQIPGSGRARQSLNGLGARATEILSGQNTTGTPGIGRQLIGAGVKQGVTRAVAAPLFSNPQEDQQATPSPLSAGSVLGDSTSMEQPMSQSMTQDEALPTALTILAMQAAANGDTQQSQSFLAIAKQLGTEQKQNADIQKQTTKASNANAIIDQLEQVFSKSGGARGPIGGRLTLLGAAAGGGNQDAKAYEELRSAYTAQISRALGEVGVLTDKDREVIQRAIPSINDSEKSKNVKIDTLRNILSDLASRSTTQQQQSPDDGVLTALQQLGY